jgi:hypothetical protein
MSRGAYANFFVAIAHELHRNRDDITVTDDSKCRI